jgi:hypothetical protein
MKNDDIAAIDKTESMMVIKTTKNSSVVFTESRQIFSNPDAMPIETLLPNYRKCVPWGQYNTEPKLIKEKIDKSEILSSNILFNVLCAYGSGVMPCHIDFDETGKKKVTPVDDPQVTAFLEENNFNRYLLEQFFDLFTYYNIFPELIASKDGKTITNISSKEATFSRWEEMNPQTGIIENHFYSAKWTETTGTQNQKIVNEITATPVLNKFKIISDLKERLAKTKDRRFIIPLDFPTPGRFYYQKPPWYAVFNSGWYDYSVAIPNFKKNAMLNQMSIKYHVEFSDKYFPKIFAEEGIQGKDKQKARKELEMQNINTYLTGTDNAKKALFSVFSQIGPDKYSMLTIKVMDPNDKGGEFLDDIEEASNIMSQAMHIHPTLAGSAPGKNGTINGTEARELFIIKQSMMAPYRDLVLYPLYIIKSINGWDPKLKFVIPNMELQTLDKGTGAQKLVSSPAVP